MADLTATIGADASDLIAETKRAGKAFSTFTADLKKEAKSTESAFAKLSRNTREFSKEAAAGAKVLRRGFSASGVTAGVKELTSDVLSLTKNFASLTRSVVGVGFKALTAAAGAARKAVGLLTKSLVAVGVALAAIGTKSLVEFAKFQKGFNQVRTLIDATPAQVRALEQDVRNLAVRFGQDLNDATRAAYQTISAGITDPEQAVKLLEVAFKGAQAGAAGVQETVDLLTSALNAFGKPVSEATKFSDVFFATVRAGKTTITELAQSIGTIAPIAAASNVSIEELGAGLATLTSTGLSTAEAATQLRALIVELQKPSAATAVELQKLGVSGETITKIGLEKTLQLIARGATATGVPFTKLFANVRAVQGATALAGRNFEKFNTIIGQTRNAVGEADKAFQKTAGDSGRAFAQLRTSIQDAFVSLGEILAPAAARAASALAGFFQQVSGELKLLSQAISSTFGAQINQFFNDLSKNATTSGSVTEKALSAITAGLQRLGSFINQLRPTITKFALGFQILGSAVNAVFQVIKTLVTGGITVLSGAVTGLIASLQRLAEAVGAKGIAGRLKSAEDQLAAFTKSLAEDTVAAANAASDSFKGVFDPDTSGIVKLDQFLSKVSVGLGNASKETARLGSNLRAIRNIAALEKLAVDAERAAKASAGLRKAVTGIATGAATAAKNVGASIGKAISGLFGFGKAADKAGAQANAGLKKASGAAKEAAASITRLGDAASKARSALSDEIAAGVDKLKASLDAGKISFDQYIDGLLKAGEQSREFSRLSADQVTAVSKLNEANKDLSRQVVDLASSLDRKLVPSLDVILKAFNQNKLTANQLEMALRRLSSENTKLSMSARDAADAQREQAGAAREAADAQAKFEEEVRQGFEQLEKQNKSFRESEAGVQLFRSSLRDVIPQIEQLRQRSDEATRAFVDKLIKGFVDGRRTAAELRKELQRVADATLNVGKAAASAAAQRAQSEAGINQFFGIGQRPGGIQFGREALGGFGIQGRVTGSANFTSPLEQQLGQALGLKPKALRSRARRSGGLENLARDLGFRLIRGGPINQTGPALVEAGEFNLSQRGVADLGKLFGNLLNQGQGGDFNQTNNFNVDLPAAERFDVRQLAFELGPELRRTAILAASTNPVS